MMMARGARDIEISVRRRQQVRSESRARQKKSARGVTVDIDDILSEAQAIWRQ